MTLAETETYTIDQFIADNELTMTCQPADSNPNMDGEDMDHWLCKMFVKNGDVLPVPFSMGRGHNGKAPELADVLDCLASDAAGWENAQNFEDWASQYGHDTDSRRAESIYATVADTADTMKAFLGDAYETLLWNTERQ